MTQHSRSDDVERNRRVWAQFAPDYAVSGRRLWGQEPSWGIWGIPETEMHLLPDSLAGLDTLELGCGTGYVSAWMARAGARPVGLDPTPEQLDTARALQAEFGVEFPLVDASADDVPFPDESFDLVISEYGASIWSDPYLWVGEAARVLRPGGRLVFLGNGLLLMLCADVEGAAGRTLLRDGFGMHRFEWPDDNSVEFHLLHSEWFRLLKANGLEVTDLLELRPPADASATYDFVTLDWARRWPSEEVWKARKRA
ncbi:MAG: methyltransferase domain-containing protein [Nitriliruptorales bacterium]|nr:methyltransferase domain-containing protein [Nitriliruptorales bacterium]